MKVIGRFRRHKRFRKRIKGDKARPRLVIFRSKKHMYVQLVDDGAQKVLTGWSTLNKDFLSQYKEKDQQRKGKDMAKELGLFAAKKAKDLGIKQVAFDRAGYKYHGRVRVFAESAREGGLEF